MKILLTGATGYIGRNFIKRLSLNSNYKVYIIVRNHSAKKKLIKINHKLKIFKVDLGKLSEIEKIFKNILPDIVYHLAWDGVANFDREKQSQILNINYSINLALASSNNNVKKFIALGSQAEYGPQNKKLSENSITIPSTLYGKVKLKTYQILLSHFKKTKTKFTWLRIFSCYGPGDHEYWFINKIILSLINKKPLKITKCEQVWDYIYIDDLINILIKTIRKNKLSHLYNIGSGYPLVLKKIVNFIKNEINSDINLTFGSLPYRPDQVMYLVPDISKISTDLNWKPKYDIYQGLKKTISYYKKNEYYRINKKN